MSFIFLSPGTLRDGDLELRLRHTAPGDYRRGWVPAYLFDMHRDGVEEKIGVIDLRIGSPPSIILYGGHIGYTVHAEHRGHHYAARSVRLLFDLARRHEMQTLWITCNPDNWASRRTCELAGGTFVEIVDLPEDSDMYEEGERQKCRYCFDLVGGSYAPGKFKDQITITDDITSPVTSGEDWNLEEDWFGS